MGRLAVATIVSLWVIPISLMVNRIVFEPYMDEIFHIPQAQQYCRGNFKSWDPMITTPPALYYLSLAHIASLFPGMWYLKVSSFSELCSTATLRSINGVLAVICSVLVYEIITLLRPALDKRKATLQAVVLSLYPLHWFFTFLYYTDVASLTVVLAMYLACLKRHYQLSALLGALSILFRQTNVVWMLLVACTGVINLASSQNSKDNTQLDGHGVSIRKIDGLPDKNSLSMGRNLRQRNKSSSSNGLNHAMAKMSTSSLNQSSGLLHEVTSVLSSLWHLKWEVLVSFSPFLVVLVAFVAFVCWNGSIVLGAKEAHAVSPHFAQMMYFGLFSVIAMAPFHISFGQATVLCRSIWKNKPLSLLQVLVALTAGFISVHFFSMAHPYLLADNRHYTFYIWRKVIKAHWLMKYLLLPLYVYSWFSIFNILGKVQKKIWLLVFLLACAGVLIPAPLIEFRYYTIPFYFLVLHSHQNTDTRSWLLIGALYIFVNMFTMMMFLYQPFHWNHEPGTQRFIW